VEIPRLISSVKIAPNYVLLSLFIPIHFFALLTDFFFLSNNWLLSTLNPSQIGDTSKPFNTA
jgi:hypothetical protein